MTTILVLLFKVAASILGIAGPAPDSPPSFVGRYSADSSESEVFQLWIKADGTFVCESALNEGTMKSKPASESVERMNVAQSQPVETRREFRGRWTFAENTLHWEWESSDPPAGSSRLPLHWLVIIWDERIYMIPEGRIIDFCNSVNLGDEPRVTKSGRWLLRDDDWRQPTHGSPKVPDDFKPHLLSVPIRGRLVEVDANGFGHLDIGEVHGLRAGMMLVAYSEGELRECRLKVLCPCDDAARVEIVCPKAGNPSTGAVVDLDIGDEVSSRLR